MEANHDIFLSMSDAEKLNLFHAIISARIAQTPVRTQLAGDHAHYSVVGDVNLKQIAAITNRNYGSVYNTYTGLVNSLEEILGRKHASTKMLFAIPIDEFRYDLVKKSNPYRFLDAVLYKRYQNFDDFLMASDSSKATILRHLKPIRGYANTSGVQFSYETLSFIGSELNIRIFLGLTYWLATNGADWPFENMTHERASEILDAVLKAFKGGDVNVVTRELLLYYIAVAHQRILTGQVLTHDPDSQILRYPMPNLFSPIAEALTDGHPVLDGLSEQQQQGESDALYFLFNFAPLYIVSDGPLERRVIERYNRYNPEIYQLIQAFFACFPYNFKLHLQLPEETYNLLLANMLSVTVSVLVFKKDFTTTLLAEFSSNMQQTKDDPAFYAQIKATLEKVVDEEHLESFDGYIDVLAEALYRNLHQLLIQFQPPKKIVVAPVVEQTITGYIDLLAFLHAIPFVELASPNANLKDADLVITTSVAPVKKVAGKAQIFPWHINVSNDHYGQLYALLRELWDKKVLEDARFIY